ncbi:D-2-hydroxyacid dehydrogenase [Cohnella sp. LGH]|uniref:Phosphoglycerate dehydrogenase-like enzyme n=2 Tax=Cohnella TaxID=329857 RepID=A0A3D9KM96_9BACL|nr:MULTISPECIES: D-2-hydroxyacid dehydrogenase [Cohnella]QTH43952.1 D-2-hydroxyacid dehydrogenase [Cohnella sp. LGH]RED87606.1 phosphoglycerate dehydrogenase-like enzyme [Cohnella phaseoli]
MPTLLMLFQLKPDQLEQVRRRIPEWTIVSARDSEITEEQYRDAEIVLGWDSAMTTSFDSAVNLKWVQTTSAGVDKLPLDRLRESGAALTSASGIHPISMTETLFAMLLAFSRNLHHAIRRQSDSEWRASERYSQLAGKTIGIVGVGAIGTEMARLAKAFGMTTLGVRKSARPVDVVDEMYGMDQLGDVLSRSDMVVNVLPYTEETHHIFNAEKFAAMKTDALFFNFGRGASVDTAALVAALEQGEIGGAGLDVFEEEPLPADHPLWPMDNVIITPHIGGWTDNYKALVTDIFLENLDAYLSTGQPTRNVVDLDRNY